MSEYPEFAQKKCPEFFDVQNSPEKNVQNFYSPKNQYNTLARCTYFGLSLIQALFIYY
jgi:hypothetical protein